MVVLLGVTLFYPKAVNPKELKFASKEQTLIKEIPLPHFTNDQLITIAIKIAKLVYKEPNAHVKVDIIEIKIPNLKSGNKKSLK